MIILGCIPLPSQHCSTAPVSGLLIPYCQLGGFSSDLCPIYIAHESRLPRFHFYIRFNVSFRSNPLTYLRLLSRPQIPDVSSTGTGAATNSNIYSYTKLEGLRDVRLITLRPGIGDDPISVEISHKSLDEQPIFEALSYVWGSQAPSYSIKCKNTVIEVGGSLRNALQCIRSPDTPRVLWIDRICINQDDINERIQQVGIMGDIYGLASGVVIWLGEADVLTEVSMSMLDMLSGQMLEHTKGRDLYSYKEVDSDDRFPYPSREDRRWACIKLLLKRPWFSRVWTFQEIVLARDALIYCGPYTIPWKKLEIFLWGLTKFSQGPNMEDSRLNGAEDAAWDLIKARAIIRELKEGMRTTEDAELVLGLFPLLDSLRFREATDPRDKVFALLNVAIDAKDSDLKANYRKSPTEVYATTAKWLLRTSTRLDFLSLVEKKDKPDLISWVPDFRYRDPWNFLHQPLRQISRGLKYRIYTTSGASKAPFTADESSYQLTVEGLYVGTIIDLTSPPGNLLNNVAIGPAVLDGGSWHEFAKTFAINGKYSPTDEPINLAYHRLRIWDQLPSESNIGPHARRFRYARILIFLHNLRYLTETHLQTSILQHTGVSRADTITEHHRSKIRIYLNQVQSLTTGQHQTTLSLGPKPMLVWLSFRKRAGGECSRQRRGIWDLLIGARRWAIRYMCLWVGRCLLF